MSAPAFGIKPRCGCWTCGLCGFRGFWFGGPHCGAGADPKANPNACQHGVEVKTGPIVKAVTTATKAQLAADQDNTPAQFDAYWHAFTPAWLSSHNQHYNARARDEAVKGRAI